MAPMIVISEEPDDEGDAGLFEPGDLLAPPENGDRPAAEGEEAPAKSRLVAGGAAGRGRGRGAPLETAESVGDDGGGESLTPEDAEATAIADAQALLPAPVVVNDMTAEPAPAKKPVRRTRKPAAPAAAQEVEAAAVPAAEAPVGDPATMVDAVVAAAPEPLLAPAPAKPSRARAVGEEDAGGADPTGRYTGSGDRDRAGHGGNATSRRGGGRHRRASRCQAESASQAKGCAGGSVAIDARGNWAGAQAKEPEAKRAGGRTVSCQETRFRKRSGLFLA